MDTTIRMLANIVTYKSSEGKVGVASEGLSLNPAFKQFYESEDGLSEKSKPFVISGWFTNFDDENIYIGTEEDTVSDMFNRKYVVHVGVSKPVDKFDDMLDNVDVPSDEEFN